MMGDKDRGQGYDRMSSMVHRAKEVVVEERPDQVGCEFGSYPREELRFGMVRRL